MDVKRAIDQIKDAAERDEKFYAVAAKDIPDRKLNEKMKKVSEAAKAVKEHIKERQDGK